MMKKIKKALTSKRVWVIIGLFAINGLDGIKGNLSPEHAKIVTDVLSIAGFVFGMYPQKHESF